MPPRRPALDIISHSPDQTRRIGYHLGRLARAGDVFLLSGNVGAGKTVFVQGLAQGLDIRDYVQSPTFALAAEHRGRAADGSGVFLFHLDFYRLEGEEDIETFGYDEYFDEPNAIVAVEWPQRVNLDLPDGYLAITLEHLAQAKRRLRFQPVGERYEQMVDALRSEVFGVQRRSAASGSR
jgi:tRNA threonylcarbamoyladenosine biosynthesis protein TsaE